MAWTSGFGTLAPGQVTRWGFSWGGADRGAQFAMGNPLNPGGSLEVSGFTKRKNNDGGITYFVTIRNIGSVTTNFNLQGGGLT
jgi:hypothetical protein